MSFNLGIYASETVLKLNNYSANGKKCNWTAGGWLGGKFASPYDVKLSAAEKGALRVEYALRKGKKHGYFHLFQRGNWDLEALRGLRLKFKGTQVEQTLSPIIMDKSGQWYSPRGCVRLWACGTPNEWGERKTVIAGEDRRHGAKLDMKHIVFIGFQVQPPKNSPQGVFYINDVEFYRVNILDDGGFEEKNMKWRCTGNAVITKSGVLNGTQALKLHYSSKDKTFPSATSNRFNISADRRYYIGGTLRCEGLFSPDPSYNVGVDIEAFDEKGKKINTYYLFGVEGTTSWKKFKKTWRAPQNAVSARLKIRMNKTRGTGWADDFFVEAYPANKEGKKDEVQLFVNSPAIGALYYPKDKLTFAVSITSRTKLPETELPLTIEVKDYCGQRWGRKTVMLKTKCSTNLRQGFKYGPFTIQLDKKDFPLEDGIYYECMLHLGKPSARLANGKSSFAILPESGTKNYPPEKIPFATQGETVYGKRAMEIISRLGCGWVRFNFSCGDGKTNWKEFETTARYNINMFLNWPEELGLKPYFYLNEACRLERKPASPKDDEEIEKMCQGIRDTLRHYGKRGLNVFKIGNESQGWDPEVVKRNMRMYKRLYETIKQVDPSALVIAPGAIHYEPYFKAGVSKYYDVHNRHLYLDIREQRRDERHLLSMAKKYGDIKPLWSCELGTKGLGVSPEQMAIDCIAKQVVFFADGGSHVSWYQFQGRSKDKNSYQDGFSLYNCRPDDTPKLCAITYYHLMDAMLVKKFADEKHWSNGTEGFLFKEKNECLVVLWNNRKTTDIFLPLNKVDKAKIIYLDGRNRSLLVAGNGLSLSVSREPVMLVFSSNMKTLPKTLGSPAITVLSDTKPLMPGQMSQVVLRIRNNVNGKVLLKGPPLWTIKQLKNRKSKDVTDIYFGVTPAIDTTATAGRFFAELINEDGKIVSELCFRRNVSGLVAVNIVPVAGSPQPSLELIVHNNSSKMRQIKYVLKLTGQCSRNSKGKYDLANPSYATASLKGATQGVFSLGAEKTKRIPFSLKKIDNQALYHVTAKLNIQGEAKETTAESWVGGFAEANRVEKPLHIDGKLDEDAWKQAIPQVIGEKSQMQGKANNEWYGRNDLSATMRFLWDKDFLYIGVEVQDDKFRNIHSNDGLWDGDGLQFLIDPFSNQSASSGFYDYALAHGGKGDQVWCHRSASPKVATGEAKGVIFVSRPLKNSSGGRTYELALPWKNLVPMEPAPGKSMGLAFIVNEDDGKGRFSYLSWFSGVSEKSIAYAGDLILK